MKGFFEEPEKGKGMKGGSDKNLSDIDKYVRPLLNDIGFDCCKDVEDESSNRQKVFLNKSPNYCFLAQIIIVENLHSIDTRANSNIPEFTVNTTSEEDRIEVHLKNLQDMGLYLFLYVKRGSWFVLFPFADIPKEHYQLTYRAKPTRKNRMWIPAEHLPMFSNIGFLKTRIYSILNIKL